MSAAGARQWRGRDRGVSRSAAGVRGDPGGHARRGRDPLVRSESLSAETGCEVWLKYEGANPTGSFKDRGMTLAISKAVEEGSKAVVCASTGNTSASAAAYAAKAGLTCAVLVPKGKIALGKMAQTLVHGARVLEVDGNFDASLELAQGPGGPVPGHAGELGEPLSPPGSEDLRRSRSATCSAGLPTFTAFRWATPATSPATGWGTANTCADGAIHEPPQLFGFQAQGAAPHRPGAPVEDPADDRLRHPHRQPGLVGQGGSRGGRVRGRDPGGHRPRDPRPHTSGCRTRGCSPSSPSAASVAGMLHVFAGEGAAERRDGRLCAHRARTEGPGVGHLRRQPPADGSRRPRRGRRRARPVDG